MTDQAIVHENRCSIQISYSAMRKEYSWEIKSYHEPGEEYEALERIEALDLVLREKYLPKQQTLEDQLEASIKAAKR